jgi:hypothetical protein
VWLALALALSACALPFANKRPGQVLFHDDFDSIQSGWTRHRGSAYTGDYQQGVYRFELLQPNLEVWSRPGLAFEDVRIEVRAHKAAGPDDNLFGLLCRYRGAGDFLFFALSSDGFAGIGLYEGGGHRLLSDETLLPNDAIVRGDGTNLLRAECIGERYAFYVNGVLLHAVELPGYQEGDVGLYAATYEQAGVVIDFDGFTVLRAAGSRP